MTQLFNELLIRFNEDETVGGAHVRYLHKTEGETFIGKAIPLTGINDPRFEEFAQKFAQAALAEAEQAKDQLVAVKKDLEETQNSLKLANDNVASLTQQLSEATSQVVSLSDELETTKNELRSIKQTLEDSQLKISVENVDKLSSDLQNLNNINLQKDNQIKVLKTDLDNIKKEIELKEIKYRQDLIEARQGVVDDGVLRATNKQVRKWLSGSGISEEQVITLINQIEDPIKQKSAMIDWEYETIFRRDNPLVITIGTALGLSESQLDLAFIEAGKII